MRCKSRLQSLRLLYLLLLLSLIAAVESKRWFSKKKDEALAEVVSEPLPASDDDDSSLENIRLESLVEWVGKQLYETLDTKKYRFFLYMTIGSLPDEETTVYIISCVCNCLYGISILFGFFVFKRERMLIITALTLYIGPAMILLVLGAISMLIAAFAFYPMQSVAALWFWFFLTSQAAQVIGKQLGLDKDNDGDVDILDLLYYFSTTSWGECLGIRKVYSMLDDISKDPFQEINKRLDNIVLKISQQEGGGGGGGAGGKKKSRSET